jgi:hypothetical protein
MLLMLFAVAAWGGLDRWRCGPVQATLLAAASADADDRGRVREGETDAQGGADTDTVAREVRGIVRDDGSSVPQHHEDLRRRDAPDSALINCRAPQQWYTQDRVLRRRTRVGTQQRLVERRSNLELLERKLGDGCATHEVICAPTVSAFDIASAKESRLV